jgi:AcrR family transcriptional regulator
MTPSNTNENQNSETREAILRAARQRFLHYGYKKTTIDEIAADAGIGKGTVYLYFCTKEEILLTIAREVKRNVTRQMEAHAASLATPEEKIRRMVIAMILAAHDATSGTPHGIELVDELFRPAILRCGQDERTRQRDLIATTLAEGTERGDFAPIADTEQAALHLLLALTSFFPPYVQPCHEGMSCRVDLERRTQAMLDFLFAGLRRR